MSDNKEEFPLENEEKCEKPEHHKHPVAPTANADPPEGPVED